MRCDSSCLTRGLLGGIGGRGGVGGVPLPWLALGAAAVPVEVGSEGAQEGGVFLAST